MKVKLFGRVLEVTFQKELSAENIEKEYLKNRMNSPKIGLIKSARIINKDLGLKQAKELVESLFDFGEFGDSYSIKNKQ